MPELRSELLQTLARAENHVDFLRVAVGSFEKEFGRGSKALLSRKAGFASRSYLSEILSGKKGLSRDSLARLRGALKLNGSPAKLLECLVALEQPEIQVPRADPQDLRRQIDGLRKELRDYTPEQGKRVAAPHLATPEVFQVYAALGTEMEGASLAEVIARTRLSERSILRALQVLKQSGAVMERAERYYAVVAKADALRSKDTQAIAEMVQKVCANIQRNRQFFVADDRNLNVYSAFSTRRERVGELKRSLEAAIFAVLDEYQDDRGDCVEQVFVSLFNKSLEGQV